MQCCSKSTKNLRIKSQKLVITVIVSIWKNETLKTTYPNIGAFVSGVCCKEKHGSVCFLVTKFHEVYQYELWRKDDNTKKKLENFQWQQGSILILRFSKTGKCDDLPCLQPVKSSDWVILSYKILARVRSELGHFSSARFPKVLKMTAIESIYESRYSRMGWVKFVEDSL